MGVITCFIVIFCRIVTNTCFCILVQPVIIRITTTLSFILFFINYFCFYKVFFRIRSSYSIFFISILSYKLSKFLLLLSFFFFGFF